MKIVTDLNGRRLSSIPRSKRRAAAKAAEQELSKPSWANAHKDPA